MASTRRINGDRCAAGGAVSCCPSCLIGSGVSSRCEVVVRFFASSTQNFLGFLVPCHYNFQCSETCHYNSSIGKQAIIIFAYSEICHWIRMTTTWARLQAYVAYEVAYPVCIRSVSSWPFHRRLFFSLSRLSHSNSAVYSSPALFPTLALFPSSNPSQAAEATWPARR
jgi:hypothetical protein